MSQLKKGVLLSYATIILTNVIGLFLTPFIIKSLGDAEYGLYNLIGAFVGYITVLDFGLNNTIVRYVSKYRAENDKEGEESFLSTTMLIYGVISLFVILLGTVLYFNLDALFEDSLTSAEIEKSKIMFIILVFNIAITLPGGGFTAICNGYENFVFPRTVTIFRYLVRSGAVVGLLLLGGDAIGLVLIDTILNIIIIIINAYYVLKKLKVNFKLHSFEKPLVRVIFSYSIWIFVFAIVQQFQWKGGQVILGMKTDTVSVAIYAVGIVLGTYYSSFSGAITSVFLPKATQMVVKEATQEELTEMMIKIGRLSLFTLLVILGAFGLYGKQFIDLWVGQTYEKSWLIALLIMISYTVPLVQNFANALLEANGKFYFKSITYLIFIVFGTALGWYLIDFFGITGMIVGINIGWVISLLIINFYYQQKLNLNIPLFFKDVFLKLLPLFALVMFIGFVINRIPGQDWVNFIFKNILFFTIYSIVMYSLGMSENEKSLVKGILKRKA